jgi:hypothetical protein
MFARYIHMYIMCVDTFNKLFKKNVFTCILERGVLLHCWVPTSHTHTNFENAPHICVKLIRKEMRIIY